MKGMNLGAAGYPTAQGGFYVPPKLVTDLYVGYHCQSITGHVSRPDFLEDEDLKLFSTVTYPVLEDDDGDGEDEYQANGRSEELRDPLSSRKVQICNNWRFHRKMARSDMARMIESEELFQTAMQEYLNRRLDRKVDAYGMSVLAASADPSNRGNRAGHQSHSIDLGSTAAPWILADMGAEDLVNNLLQAFDEAEVTCSNPMLTLIVPPMVAARLRKDQSIDINDDSDSPRFTGKFRHAYGFNVISSVRCPSKLVNGKMVYYVIAVDHRQFGAPSNLVYMEWQIIGHDAILFGEFIWDAFVFNGKGVAVAAVTAKA